MHTIASEDGKSRVHFNGDFSGDFIFINGKREVRVPEDLIQSLVESYAEDKTDKLKNRFLHFLFKK